MYSVDVLVILKVFVKQLSNSYMDWKTSSCNKEVTNLFFFDQVNCVLKNFVHRHNMTNSLTGHNYIFRFVYSGVYIPVYMCTIKLCISHCDQE